MILDYETIQDLLSGTPLAGLSDTELNEALVGDYPITHSSKQIANKWDRIKNEELWQIQAEEAIVTSVFDQLLIQLYRDPEKNEEKIKLVEFSYRWVKESCEKRKDNIALTSIIGDCQKLAIKYEQKIRSLKAEIENLKNNIQ